MKMLIIGYSGAGKTTLADTLGAGLGCSVFHVDEAMYGEDGKMRTASEAMRIAEALMSDKTEWIIDGYRTQCIKDEWLAEADRIVFLNIGRWTCFWQVCKRYFTGIVCRRKPRGRPCSQLPVNPQPKASIWNKTARLFLQVPHHLAYIIWPEHCRRFEHFYMAFGDKCPEKFSVLCSQGEIDRFQEAVLGSRES